MLRTGRRHSAHPPGGARDVLAPSQRHKASKAWSNFAAGTLVASKRFASSRGTNEFCLTQNTSALLTATEMTSGRPEAPRLE